MIDNTAVSITVRGRAAGRGGSYDVRIYDQDLIWDDELDNDVANGVPPGNFIRVHTFFLKCNQNCNVAGRLRSSGESTAEIYAWVNGGRNVTAMSRVTKVSCVDIPPKKQKKKSKKEVKKKKGAVS